MARCVTNVASSGTSKKYAKVPGAVWLLPLKWKLHKQDSCIEMVKINLLSFNPNHSAIIANLKTSSNKATIAVIYKADMGSDGNTMPFNIFKKLYPSATADQMAATKDATKLRTYNHTTITQLDRCKIEIENNNKQKKNAFSL